MNIGKYWRGIKLSMRIKGKSNSLSWNKRGIWLIGLLMCLIIEGTTNAFAQTATPEYIDSLKQSLTTIQKSDKGSKAEIKTLLRLCYYTIQDPTTSQYYGKLAVELTKQKGELELEADAYSYLSNSEKYMGNYSKAVEYMLLSAKIHHELKQYHDEAYNFSSLSKYYGNLGDYTNARYYYDKAIKGLQEYNDTLFYASTQSNMGEFFRIYAEPDSAIDYYEKALQTFESIKKPKYPVIMADTKITAVGNLGMTYLLLGQLEKAKPLLLEADRYFTEHFEAYRKSVYQSELGKLYILEGERKKGEELIQKSIEMAKSAQLKEQIRDFSLELSEFYEQQKQDQLALEYFKQYKLYDDSLQNVDNVRKIEQQQSQFQLSRKDEEIASLNKINKLQRVLGVVLFLGVLTTVFFIFIVSRANKRIQLINREISEQKQLLEQREKEKALLLRELNHRVKNNLQMVASLLNLHARQLKNHPAAEALLEGKYRVEALTLIHQKLYKDDIDTKIDIKDYIEELAQNLVLNFSRDFNLDLQLESLIMKIDKAIPLGLMLNELLTNSLKYGRVEGKQPYLKISIKKLPETMILSIEDNGQGLPEDFDFNRTESFGLKLVHSLAKQLGGDIKWNSDKGTHWKIILITKNIS